jgi:hypothetical protein
MKNYLLLALALLALYPTTVTAQNYCAPYAWGFACGGDGHISNVTILSSIGTQLLNKTSSCQWGSGGSYENYLLNVPHVTLHGGQTYSIAVTVAFWAPGDNVRVWLDTNDDGSFEGSNETLVSLTGPWSSNPTQMVTGQFTVPSGALTCNTRLRLRLLKAVSSVQSPISCSNSQYGNIEDYGVNLIGAPQAAEWQVNQTGASMSFDGVLATASLGASVARCVGVPVAACATSNGNLAEIFINASPTVGVSAGGLAWPGNIFNLNIASGVAQLFGTFTPINLCPISFPAPPWTFSAQMLAIDFTASTGLTLSQACELVDTPASSCPGTYTLPPGDDDVVVVNLMTAPVNHGPVNFYGAAYTQLAVSNNGIVFPGALGSTAYYPTVSQAMAMPGSVGIWSDWRPDANPAASVVVNGAGAFGGVDVTYTNVPYWGTPVTSTFAVGFENNGVRIAGISGLGTFNMPTMLLLSGGSGITATNAGATAFSLGGTGSTSAATDMLYALGIGSPSLGGGANTILFNFVPAGVTWIGL